MRAHYRWIKKTLYFESSEGFDLKIEHQAFDFIITRKNKKYPEKVVKFYGIINVI